MWWLVSANRLASFGSGAPPVENLTVERTILDNEWVRLLVRAVRLKLRLLTAYDTFWPAALRRVGST